MAKNNEFITISLSKLEPNEGQLEGLPSNPRQITEAKMALLKQNIKQYPEMLKLRSLMVYPMDNGKYIIIGGNMHYTEDEIVRQIASYNANFVVFTGGEPTLQLTESLVDKVHAIRDDMYIAVESNGTHDCVGNVNWLTISPKDLYLGEKAKICRQFCNEFKIVWDGVVDIPNYLETYLKDWYLQPHLYLQPCDTGDIDKNKEIINKCVEFVKNNPKWKLSIQLQKILNVR